jgi:hypothetical protein
MGARRRCRVAGCSSAARRPAWRRRRSAQSCGRSGYAVAGTQPAGDRSLRLPAMAAQPDRRLDPTSGDPNLDPAPGEVAATAAVVIGLVGVDLARPTAPPTSWRPDLWGGRPAMARTPPRREHWPRSPAVTAAARPPRRLGAAWIRAWPGRLGLRQCGPPQRCDARPVQLISVAELVQQRLLESLEDAGGGPLGQPPPTAGHAPTAELATGSSAHGVEVRAMKTIAAMQARSETVRGAPPARSGGWRWQRGWMRCHSGSGSSQSASVVMSRDHHTIHPTAAHPPTRFRNVLYVNQGPAGGDGGAECRGGGRPLITRTEEARGSNPLTSTPPLMTSGVGRRYERMAESTGGRSSSAMAMARRRRG